MSDSKIFPFLIIQQSQRGPGGGDRVPLSISIDYYSLIQWWATLFGSQATLATNLVYTGQYTYNKDLFDLAFERKWVFKVHFLKRSILSGILNVF